MQQIIIIGASLTGLTTALALNKIGLEVILVDCRSLGKKTNDGRAIALTAGSQQTLEKINLWNSLKNFTGQINQIRVTDEYSPLHLHFNNNDTLGYLIESDDMLSILIDEAKKSPNILIYENSTYKIIENNSSKITLKINDQIFRPELLIAADGKFSILRKFCNIDTIEHDYQQTAIVCKVHHEFSHQSIAQEFFQTHGPFAVLPLAKEHQSGIVWTETPEIAETLLKLPQNEFEFFLEKKFTDYLGKVNLISKPISYPLKLVLAKEYYKGKIILVGDSAHSIHPIAGQGFNLSLRDIDLILDLIPKYQNLGLKAGCSQFMNEYQKVRKFDNYSMAIITDGLNRLFANNFIGVKYLRKIGLKLVNNIPTLKNFFMNYAMRKKL